MAAGGGQSQGKEPQFKEGYGSTPGQIAPGQPFYAACPRTKKDVMVARECIGCDRLRGFNYEKMYLDCRGEVK
jgi:hypothetical protein